MKLGIIQTHQGSGFIPLAQEKASQLGCTMMLFPELVKPDHVLYQEYIPLANDNNISCHTEADIMCYSGEYYPSKTGVLTGYGCEEKKFFRRYNTYSILLSHLPTTVLKYRKQRLFPGYDNNRTPGKEMPHIWLHGKKTYVAICYDIRFDDVFEQMKDPDLIIIPADFPRTRITDWITLLQYRAIQKKCTIVGVNTSDGGHSMVVGKDGQIIEQVKYGEHLMVVEV